MKVGFFFEGWQSSWKARVEQQFTPGAVESRYTIDSTGFNIDIDALIQNEVEYQEYSCKVGGNIGNDCFRYSLRKTIDTDVVYIDGDSITTNSPNDIDILIISAANWLNENRDNQHIVKVIKHFNKPVIIVGLGTQTINNIVPESLKVLQKPFLDTLWNIESEILVRGNSTYKVIESMGYNMDRVTIFGCPSLFLNTDINLADKINNKLKTYQNNSTDSCKKVFYPSYFSKLSPSDKIQLDNLKRGNNYMLLQTFPENLAAAFQMYHRFPKVEQSLTAWQQHIDSELIKKMIYIENIHEQATFLINNIDYTYGTRIHGAMLSLMSELPALLIYWDDRTRELSEELCVPAMSQRRFATIVQQGKLDTLPQFIKFRPRVFNKNRKHKANILYDTYKKYNVPLSLNVKKLADEA
tara:strand:+ start:3088 stop:4320 length:1233 start_codon:yes stop_codon:yes gene_type:complete